MTKPIQVKGLTIGEGMPKICVPIMGKDLESLSRETRKAKEAGADLVEWRADFFEELSDTAAAEQALLEISRQLGETPLLFTIRTKEEGGNRQISTKDYVNLNLAAARTKKADLIDVELFRNEEEMTALIKELQKEGAVVVASTHDFEKTDDKETLKSRFLAMDRSGADILKMAVMPDEFEDVSALMLVTNEMIKELTEKPVISMAMGSLGSISRIAGENFGSSVTFACVGQASAPGQFPIRELRTMMDALHEKNQK